MAVRTKGQRVYYLLTVLVFILLGTFLLEKSHILYASVMDDLFFGSYFCNASIGEAVFSGGYKFRPVSNFVMWLIAHIFQGNLYAYGYFNLIYNALCAFLIFNLVRKFLRSDMLAAVSTVLYVVSRFSYYQITQQLGVMETTCTILGICFIWFLYQYMESLHSKDFYYALLFYFLCCMSHERYTVLMPVILYAWFFSGERKKSGNKGLKKYKKPLIVVAVFFLIMVLFLALVNNVMTGTGGTDVTETISFYTFFLYLAESIAYLFSINSPALYLSMIGIFQYSLLIWIVVLISIMMIFLIVGISIWEIAKMEKEERNNVLIRCGMFLLPVMAMVFISSVTLRVELRWMYYPYMVAVFFLVYLIQISKHKKTFKWKQAALFIYMITMIVFNLYCRQYYGSLYYWPDYKMANALSDSTYGEYGEKMYSKSWVIITQQEFKGANSTYENVLKQFDPYDEYDLELEVIDSVDELAHIENLRKKQILYYDAKKGEFINVSRMIKSVLPKETKEKEK